MLLVEAVRKSGLDTAISAGLTLWRKPRAVLASGKTIRLVTDPNKPFYTGGNGYQRELKYLRDKGYGWRKVGDYWEVFKVRP